MVQEGGSPAALAVEGQESPVSVPHQNYLRLLQVLILLGELQGLLWLLRHEGRALRWLRVIGL